MAGSRPTPFLLWIVPVATTGLHIFPVRLGHRHTQHYAGLHDNIVATDYTPRLHASSFSFTPPGRPPASLYGSQSETLHLSCLTIVKYVRKMNEETKQIVKQAIIRLHSGEDPSVIRAEYGEVLRRTSPHEIARIEEELIREGMTREQVRELCDVHLAVFQEALHQSSTRAPPGHPVHTLMSEHDTLLELANELRGLSSSLVKGRTDIQSGLKRLREIVVLLKASTSHYLREENALFPFLEKHGVSQPPAIMWMEHDKIRETEKHLFGLVDDSDEQLVANMPLIAESSLALSEMLASHFFKENSILFPTAMRLIRQDEWSVIGDEFNSIGFCPFTPDSAQSGTAGVEQERGQEQVQGSTGDEIEFDTGSMSREVVEAIFNTLPVDLTFVDAGDRVRFFSDSGGRIFVRSKAVLGREVRRCHPPKSIDVVDRILDDFRTGRRDSAEFWIRLHGRLIYIRYLALRDKSGQYLGCLEVTQDVTDIQQLQGEKRLLD